MNLKRITSRTYTRVPFGAVLGHELRSNLLGIMVWGTGLSAFAIMTALVFPAFQESQTLLNLLARMGVLDMLTANYGVDSDTVVGFKGYLAFQMLEWGPLLLSLYVVPRVLTSVLNEEKQGTLEVVLNAPIPRWQLLTEKALALAVSLVGILIFIWVTLLLVLLLLPQISLQPLQMSAAVWHMLPIMLVITSFSFLVSAMVKRAQTAAGIIVAALIVSFVVRAMADVTRLSVLLFIKGFSIFNYYSSITILNFGLQPEWDIPLLLTAVVVFLGAVWLFERRDLRA